MKNRIALILTPAILVAAAALPVAAIDLEAGEELYSENCIHCHSSRMGGEHSLMYTRKDRRIKNKSGLQQMVQFCANQINLQWFDEDVDDVAAYLNKNYYHFTK